MQLNNEAIGFQDSNKSSDQAADEVNHLRASDNIGHTNRAKSHVIRVAENSPPGFFPRLAFRIFKESYIIK